MKIRSAGKREEVIRDIPASVTILTREDIDRYGWATLEELLRNVPGFFVLDNIGSGSSATAARWAAGCSSWSTASRSTRRGRRP